MNNIDFLTIEAMTNIGVIVGITFLTILFIRTIVVGSLLKITGKSDSVHDDCLLYTSPSPRDLSTSRMPSSA